MRFSTIPIIDPLNHQSMALNLQPMAQNLLIMALSLQFMVFNLLIMAQATLRLHLLRITMLMGQLHIIRTMLFPL